MSTHAAPIKIRVGNSLEVEDGATNVATSQAEAELIKQANIDGKDVAPASVTTTFMSTTDGVFHGAMQSGAVLVGSGGVTITSDSGEGTPTTGIHMSGSKLQLIKDSSLVVDLDGTTGDASFLGTVAAGSTIAGSMTAGSIAVGSGGVVISNNGGTSGIYIGANVIRTVKSGSVTFQVDGDTGIVSATKFSLIADATSGIDLTLGNHVFATSITVGAETLGNIQNNATAGAGKATTFAQTGVPTALAAGDLWCDTDDGNKLYRAAAAGANEIKAGEWVAVQDTAYTSKNVTFAQDGIPTSLSAGDLWIDTNDGNKTYRAVAAGANEIKAGEWILYRDAGAVAGGTAVQPGNGFGVNASNEPSTILLDSAGISIYTAASGARLLLNNAGLSAKATISGVAKDVVTLDSTNGIRIINYTSTPSVAEGLSLAYNNGSTTVIKGALYASTDAVYMVNADASSKIYINNNMGGYDITIDAKSGSDVYINATNLYCNGSAVAKVGSIQFESGGSVDPTIKATSAPSEGGTSTEPLGSLRLGTGGSLWYTYLDGATNKWTRIWSYNHHS